ncbi:MAG TPA: citrate synthase, partial [Gammaproteobacteria bacterium]|nr:citrate synthase [Gammaproteobacteria bacterium]
MTRQRVKVQRRNESFVQRTVTRIWQEQASAENPYITESCRCHGYDLLELMSGRSYVDVLYLLFRGELPGKNESMLLEALMIAMINPGPRHPATRAAMNAGVGKTDPVHILPIALTVMGGSHLGAGQVEVAMRFLRKHRDADPDQLASDLLKHPMPAEEEDWRLAPGFGRRFADAECLSGKIARQLAALPGSGAGLRWGCAFADALAAQRLGWLNTGVVAAALVDLGFYPRDGAGVFQLLSAPGLLAHGMELANKPVTAMPYVDDE